MAKKTTSKKSSKPSTKKVVLNDKKSINLKQDAIHLSSPLKTLSRHFISASQIKDAFGIKEPVGEKHLARFISLNRLNLEFLDIKAEGVYEPGRQGIRLTTGRYAGAIPIKNPLSSMYSLDIEVKGSYTSRLSDEEFYSILTEIGADLLPEYVDRLRLIGKSLRAPIYIECEEFLKVYEEVIRSNWHKFRSVVKIEPTPRGNTDWRRYALHSHDPQRTLHFQNRVNILSADHKEFHQVNYVFTLVCAILDKLPATSRVRRRCQPMIARLKNLPETRPTLRTERLMARPTDSPIVKRLKMVANRILSNTSERHLAWRLDISKLFECYVQACLRHIGDGWQLKCNPKYPISGRRSVWGLANLEPDMLLRKDGREIVVDAKYKSHMLNAGAHDTHQLKDSFRHDLHQVLAYSSLSSAEEKEVALIYPILRKIQEESAASESDTPAPAESPIRLTTQTLTTPYSGCRTRIHLIGIPFEKGMFKEVDKALRGLLHLSSSV